MITTVLTVCSWLAGLLLAAVVFVPRTGRMPRADTQTRVWAALLTAPVLGVLAVGFGLRELLGAYLRFSQHPLALVTHGLVALVSFSIIPLGVQSVRRLAADHRRARQGREPCQDDPGEVGSLALVRRLSLMVGLARPPRLIITPAGKGLASFWTLSGSGIVTVPADLDALTAQAAGHNRELARRLKAFLMCHELAHALNGETFVAAYALGLLQTLRWWFPTLLCAYYCANLVFPGPQLAWSSLAFGMLLAWAALLWCLTLTTLRLREYLADELAMEIVGPEHMPSLLEPRAWLRVAGRHLSPLAALLAYLGYATEPSGRAPEPAMPRLTRLGRIRQQSRAAWRSVREYFLCTHPALATRQARLSLGPTAAPNQLLPETVILMALVTSLAMVSGPLIVATMMPAATWAAALGRVEGRPVYDLVATGSQITSVMLNLPVPILVAACLGLPYRQGRAGFGRRLLGMVVNTGLFCALVAACLLVAYHYMDDRRGIFWLLCPPALVGNLDYWPHLWLGWYRPMLPGTCEVCGLAVLVVGPLAAAIGSVRDAVNLDAGTQQERRLVWSGLGSVVSPLCVLGAVVMLISGRWDAVALACLAGMAWLSLLLSILPRSSSSHGVCWSYPWSGHSVRFARLRTCFCVQAMTTSIVFTCAVGGALCLSPDAVANTAVYGGVGLLVVLAGWQAANRSGLTQLGSVAWPSVVRLLSRNGNGDASGAVAPLDGVLRHNSLYRRRGKPGPASLSIVWQAVEWDLLRSVPVSRDDLLRHLAACRSPEGAYGEYPGVPPSVKATRAAVALHAILDEPCPAAGEVVRWLACCRSGPLYAAAPGLSGAPEDTVHALEALQMLGAPCPDGRTATTVADILGPPRPRQASGDLLLLFRVTELTSGLAAEFAELVEEGWVAPLAPTLTRLPVRYNVSLFAVWLAVTERLGLTENYAPQFDDALSRFRQHFSDA